MKQLFLVSLILSFVSLAVFGFLGMSYAMSHGHAACVASAAQNLDCPAETDRIGFVSFHLDALKSFSKAVFGENLLFLIAALFLAIVFSAILKFSFRHNFFSRLQRGILKEFSAFQIRREFASWLALHEKSPTLVS